MTTIAGRRDLKTDAGAVMAHASRGNRHCRSEYPAWMLDRPVSRPARSGVGARRRAGRSKAFAQLNTTSLIRDG